MNWQPEIAISTACFDGYPLQVALEALSDFDGVSIELAYIAGYVESFSEDLFTETHAGEVVKLLVTSGTACSAVSAHTDLATEGGLDRGLRRIRFAAEIGAKKVITNAAAIRNRDTFLSNLDQFAREAERCDIDLLLENPGDGITNVVDDGGSAAELAGAYAGTRIGINYDFGNVISHFRESVRPEDDWLPVRQLARYFHLKDVARQEDQWYYPELGTGMIDYRSILKVIALDRRVDSLGLELPLRLRRTRDVPNGRTSQPMRLNEIIGTVQRSLEFLKLGVQ
jgi:sugar phosphate isomerase/epimerase